MELRTFIPNSDSTEICKWIKSEREHALWCANKFSYPLEKELFDDVLKQNQAEWKDEAFIAENENNEIIGFFCFSLNADNIAFLKYVLIAPQFRNKGMGKQMIALALDYIKEIKGANAVQLNVFHSNVSAINCYRKMNFTVKSETVDAFMYQDESWNRINMWHTF